jgi:hypothetical protein
MPTSRPSTETVGRPRTHCRATSPEGGYVEGGPDTFNEDAYGGPGPDTYRLPELDADDTYRICISFGIRHRSATGCSAPFHSN